MVQSCFYGTYDFLIDGKGRLSIPAEFRKRLAEEGQSLVYLRPVDGCIQVIPATQAAAIAAAEFPTITPFDKEQRAKMRRWGATLQARSIDSEGRIVVPQHLIEYAGLKERVKLVGTVSYFEIWAHEKWQDAEESAGGTIVAQ